MGLRVYFSKGPQWPWGCCSVGHTLSNNDLDFPACWQEFLPDGFIQTKMGIGLFCSKASKEDLITGFTLCLFNYFSLVYFQSYPSCFLAAFHRTVEYLIIAFFMSRILCILVIWLLIKHSKPIAYCRRKKAVSGWVTDNQVAASLTSQHWPHLRKAGCQARWLLQDWDNVSLVAAIRFGVLILVPAK